VIKFLLWLYGFRFVVVQGSAVFMALDERALNGAVRDYVDLLDNGGDEISPIGKECYPGILHAQTTKGKCLICK
jgi:hypothetical protein